MNIITTETRIAGATSDTYTPVTGDIGSYLWAEASYTDGKGGDDTETNMASKQSDNMAILDARNRAPEFKVKPRVLSVAENAEGANIGHIKATDANDGDTLTYSLRRCRCRIVYDHERRRHHR